MTIRPEPRDGFDHIEEIAYAEAACDETPYGWDCIEGGEEEDYEEMCDYFEGDGQPDEYTEWQDLYGGDDWDHGQYDEY